MDLLQEYKELYYKELEFNDRLNNKITTCITFLTVLGSALIFLWTQVKDYELCWYVHLYLFFCVANTIMFIVCIYKFFRAYSGYKRPTFPIKKVAHENDNVLKNVCAKQKKDAHKLLEEMMAVRFVNDAIENRKLNDIKSKRHNCLIKMIMATFIVTFITFSINVLIDYYETKVVNDNTQEINVQIGGEINVK